MTLNKMDPSTNSTAIAERGRAAAGERYRPFQGLGSSF